MIPYNLPTTLQEPVARPYEDRWHVESFGASRTYTLQSLTRASRSLLSRRERTARPRRSAKRS